jgi:hypothetical protein
MLLSSDHTAVSSTSSLGSHTGAQVWVQNPGCVAYHSMTGHSELPWYHLEVEVVGLLTLLFSLP